MKSLFSSVYLVLFTLASVGQEAPLPKVETKEPTRPFKAQHVFDPTKPVIFQDDFSSNQFRRWNFSEDDRYGLQKETPERISIVDAPDLDAGRKAARFFVPRGPDSFRAEVSLPHEKGFQERWYGGCIYVPKDWVLDTTRGVDIVMQWHGIPGNGKATYPNLEISIGNSNWFIAQSFGNAKTKPERPRIKLEEPLKPGAWVSWVVHAKWSPHDDGVLQIWKDKTLVLDQKGPNVYGDIGVEYTPYLKTGIYRPEWHLDNERKKAAFAQETPVAKSKTIYVTDVKIGDARATYEMIEPKVAGVSNAAKVSEMPGCVAFWDFVRREPAGLHRFTAHVPAGATNDFPLDAGNYIKDYWSEGREATYADFPLLGRGPFGNAIRIVKETDASFRPFLFVPRERLHNSPIDIKGAGKSVSVVVWAIRESGNHALAGIWHEGTDLKQQETSAIQKVQRGQRQYALFAGLNKEGSACGHVSENGASSFLNKYALHKCNSVAQSPTVPADSPAEVLDASWQCFAMTFNHETQELTGWLNGTSGDRWLENPQNDNLLKSAYNAYMQGYFNREPGLQPGEDPDFPKDQYYNPPEDKPVSTKVLTDTADEHSELQEYRYTRVKVTTSKGKTTRELVALRLNPWWYPHALYTPKDDGSGGPFTIGRVIHSSRSVGFTGWIGGVAVFNRALTSEELGKLSSIRQEVPIATSSPSK